ncbi:MAG TPA: hypothetical protein VJ302_12550 [Blastocatellia bacterium]|nr:hypothetical protein [Blastocatellia bacterium]
MSLLEQIFVGLLYLPFLLTPFALLFWYAFVAKRHSEQSDATVNQPEEQVQSAGQ